MFEEMKKFLKGKDPLFYQELNNIEEGQNEFSPSKEEQEENERQLKIIAKYRQTDAYKRLLKRQGQAVRRIERIKENFEKKRMQVGMLAVNTKGNMGSQIDNNADHQRFNDFEEVLYEERIIEENCETDREQKDGSVTKNEESDLKKYDNGSRPSLRQVLSSQTPLSYQVIMEERSSIASIQVTNNDKSEMKSNLDKMKDYQKVQPYMKTQVNYFKRSNPNRKNNSQGKRLKSLNKNSQFNQPDNLSLNFSQVYESQHNMSNDSPKPMMIPNQKSMLNQDMQYVTGIQVYQTEILKNKSLLKSEQKSFYQPSILQNQPINQNFQSQIRTSKSRGTALINDQSSTQSKLHPSSVKSNKRPYTTANGKKYKQDEPGNDRILLQNNTYYSEVFKKSQNSNRSHSGQINQLKPTEGPHFQRNNQLPKMMTQSKENLKQALNQEQQNIQNSTVKELDEEQQDSRYQSKKQTINSGDANNSSNIINNSRSYAQDDKLIRNVNSYNPKQNASFNLSRGDKRFSEKKYLSAQRIQKDSSDIFQKFGVFSDQGLNQSDISKSNQVNGFKNPVQSYNFKKNLIVQNIKSKDYWPESIKHPNQYREFYWAPDLSFCGFATNNNINRSNKNLESKQQTSQIQRRQRTQQRLFRIKQTDIVNHNQDRASDIQSQEDSKL
ncbi:UNKNOWN [Stylonychia lemnae]|uniref:Uncharacterized protein n=1 Tax=Stylonychia lemnae TaxID=5949 RepID=A0A078AGN4_STYLE|nr:UNKNOWN [Stylonychia lemnae]|eukprot:CDW80018.1 UNKNOWN [Stylonychia lemnae]